MASGFTDFGENKVNDAVYGNNALGQPATWYIALTTTAPGESSGGTEVSGGNYARIPVTNNTTNFPNGTNGSKTNGTAITSNVSSAAWGTIIGIELWDSASGGNRWSYADIAAGDQQNINAANQQWSLPAGSLTLQQT